ncbi:MFS transporter [Paraburkholderia ribeironis]|nr:MFS transporter [Paraburkholderia ribeironis]
MDHDRQQRRVLLATSLSYVIVILDTSIVNVALERIATGLAGGVSGLQWVVNAYTLVFASLLLTGGTLSDRFGARGVYIGGLAAFTVASALCGFAPSLAVLITARALQGVGAALLVPASMTLINQTWSNPRERAAVFGMWAGLGGVAMASGPLLGGVLIGLSGWRSIFLANVPIGIAGIFMAWRVARRSSPTTVRRLDVAGQLAGMAALALLNVSLIEAPVYGWGSATMIGCVAATLVASAVFVTIESRHAQPMLPLTLFRDRVFSGCVIVSMVSAFTVYGLLFNLSLYFQQQRGYTPLHAGLAFLPLTVVVPAGSLLARRAVQWLGSRWLIVGALLLAASGYLALSAIGPSARDGLLALPLPAIGFAASLITPATTVALMACVDGSRAGLAAGVLNAARQTGAALGVAISGVLIATRPSFIEGMRASLLIAAMLSMIAGMVWWRASAQADAVCGDGDGNSTRDRLGYRKAR